MSPSDLFTVIPIHKGAELPPRYDLRPMNHAAACNFMDACRNSFTDYKIHPWPDSVPHPGEPLIAKGYRRDTSRTARDIRAAFPGTKTETSGKDPVYSCHVDFPDGERVTGYGSTLAKAEDTAWNGCVISTRP